jgi:hypothetical protein
VELVTGRRFTDDEIDAALGRKLERMNAQFYLHTDAHAVHRIAHTLHENVRKTEELIRNPGDRHDEVLQALLNAPGCGHMAGLVQRTGSYAAVRPAIPRAIMRGFYQRLWDPDPRISSKMYHHVLGGNHSEKAVLLLDGEGGESDATALVQPQRQHSSVFVVDKKMMRLSNRRFIQQASDILHVPSREIDPRALADALGEIEEQHLEASRLALAPNHPIFLGTMDSRRRKIDVRMA